MTERRTPPLEPSLLIEMYRRMLTIRFFEEAVFEVYRRGWMPGLAHLSDGQEATPVGVCMALRPDDTITSTHRGHGHIIAKGGQVEPMMAEVMGKVTGYCRGKGGEMHIADVSLGILGANGIVGGGLGIAAGSAFTAKREGKGRVSVAFFGDGAANQGLWYETANIAVLWKLPLIYVCENNQYTEFTHWKKLTAGEGLAVRARAMGMPGIEVDGNDVVAVYQAARELVERARRGEGPATLVCHTIRYGGHHVGDPGTAYRTKEEMEEWRKKDPIERCERLLLETGILSPQAIEATRNEIYERVQKAVEQARQDPFPPVEEVYEHVYA
ncbi:MAG: thiamine pyrophosphate-dependent dehydrogenase E1 component subunit alpha [Anaerolineales bacterium]|nr:thiamine pyrophosphate-dependent dehydrogenase E1 component subunit alpha [Anaerolineales bacterium]MDW8161775.1 thiamine pyrophosphate-dependent dehydrogenase E1 component subunit alpha [Anaerolineales bacterium]